MSKETNRQALSDVAQAVANVEKRKEEIALQAKIKSQPLRKKKNKRRESSQKAIEKAKEKALREKARKGSPAEREKYQVILENHKKKDLLTSGRRVPGSFGQGKRR
jgi:hypothetical protein